MKHVLELLDIKFRRTRTDKVKEIIEDWMRFRDDKFEDDGELLLGMKEINQRRKDLKKTEDEWVTVWMLSIVKKRKRINKFIHQELINVVKDGGTYVLENFEKILVVQHIFGI